MFGEVPQPFLVLLEELGDGAQIRNHGIVLHSALLSTFHVLYITPARPLPCDARSCQMQSGGLCGTRLSPPLSRPLGGLL